MPTHLYCLLPANSASPEALVGLGGGAVRALRVGSLDAWVSTVDDGRAPAGRDALVAQARAHDAVVSAALARGTTPLPARFGQRFADDAACVTELASRGDTLLRQLARVDGCVEMTLATRMAGGEAATERVRQEVGPEREREASAGGAGGGGAGRAYLERLKAALSMEREMQLRAAAVRRRVTETVGALVRDEVVQVQPSPSASLSISHLVPRASVDAYRAAVGGLRDDPALPPLVLIGPLAPWRFAEVPRG